jgi:hypothetical protein
MNETDSPRAWVAVVSMAGYLPEAEPFFTESAEQARESLIEDIERAFEDESPGRQRAAEVALAEIRGSDHDDGLTYIDMGGFYMAFEWRELHPDEFRVCAQCHTPSDEIDHCCWNCGSYERVEASEIGQ